MTLTFELAVTLYDTEAEVRAAWDAEVQPALHPAAGWIRAVLLRSGHIDIVERI
jgi:hypothetical protein